ncbi:MAG: molybdopterin biosynthesis protein [bacterium]|nr:molybdopterin biosynthesis protein [bacterium]
MKRRTYFKMKTLDEAKEIFLGRSFPLMEGEWINTEDSIGRVTASSCIAQVSSPSYHSSAMDGIVLKASSTFGATETNPRLLELDKEAFFINTGDPILDNYDSVIKIEDVYVKGNFVEIRKAATPFQNIRMVGEDITKGEQILPTNHKIRAQDLGALIGGGITSVFVRKRPHVSIIPTGSELIYPGEELKKGKIIEYNTVVLKELVKEWGGEGVRCEIIPDDYEMIRKKILQIFRDSDIIVINAGTSSGDKDYVPRILEDLGRLLVHGVSIMPGKPLALGIVENKPVIGIPGFPVSSIIAAEEFLKPLILKMLGLKERERQKVTAQILQKIPSKSGVVEFLRVNVGWFKDRFIAIPEKRGAGLITSLVKGDGILRIEEEVEGLMAGEKVEIELLKDGIKNNIIFVGSHDITLDILQDMIKERYPEINLCIIPIGSLGGLVSLKRGEAHLSGIHLLDESTGKYNLPYVTRLFPVNPPILVNLVYREQGLIIKRGNPKSIKGLKDLTKDGIKFINRQKGSGTRILLDYELGKLKIDPNLINGYENEVFTHMVVASSVEEGAVDCGLGIKAAAQAFGLDFIPITKERYDLAISSKYYDDYRINRLIEVVNSSEFKQKIRSLGGYDIKETGRIISI